MTVVGSATIVIRAVTEKLRADIKRGLDDAAKQASVGGDQAGKNFTTGFGQHVRSDVARSLDSVDFSAFQQKARDSGQFSSLSFSQSFGAVDLSQFKNKVDDALAEVPDAARKAGDAAAKEGGSGGRRFSRAFGDGIDDGHISARFRRIVLAILTIGPAILAALGGISALVVGLFSIASAATPALGALALFPTALAALGASALTVGLAFGGIGKAVKALGAQQASAGKTALNTARQQETAARQIQAAEERLASAQERARDAQLDLTRARETAREKIEDLALSLRGSVLDEEGATLRLKRAREEFNKVNTTPSTAADQAEASLNLREAELALDRAREHRLDLQNESAKASKAGVEGSDEVVAANKRIADANKDVISAQRDVANATKDAQVAMTGMSAAAVKTQNAFAGLSKEAAAFARFLFASRKEFNSLREAAGKDLFPKLTVALKNLITNLFPSLRIGLRSVGSAIGDASIIFSKAFTSTANMKNLVTFMKDLTPLIQNVGKIFGIFSGTFLSFLVQSSPALLRLSNGLLDLTTRFDNFIKSGEKTGKVNEFLQTALTTASFLGRVLSNIIGLVRDLGKAAIPAGLGLIGALDDATTRMREFTGSADGQTKLRDYFQDVAANVKPIADLLGDIFLAFLKLAADPRMGEFARQIKEEISPAMSDLTENFLKTVPSLITFVAKVTEFLAAVSESNAVAIFVGVLGGFADVLTRLIKTPLIGDVILGIVGMTAAFKALGLALKITGTAGIANFILRITGLTKALAVLKFNLKVAGAIIEKTLKKALLAAGKAVLALGKAILRALVPALVRMAAAVGLSLGAFGLIILAVAALAAGLIYAYKHSEKFRRAVHAVGDAISKAVKFVLDHKDFLLVFLGPIGTLILAFKNLDKIKKIIGDIVSAVIGFFKRLFDVLVGHSIIPDLVKAILGLFGKLLTEGLKSIGRLVSGIIGFFGGLAAKIAGYGGALLGAAAGLASKIGSGLKNGVSAAINGVVGLFKRIPDGLKNMVTTVYNAAKTLGTALYHGIKVALSGVASLVKTPINILLGALRTVLSTLGKIKISIPGWVPPPFGGKSFGIPDLSDKVPRNLAKGAVVLPRRGGTLANLAEAGRAEAVVDEGLLNKRLAEESASVAELKLIRRLLEQIENLGGINIENLNATAAPKEDAAVSVPRALRSLAFQLGS